MSPTRCSAAAPTCVRRGARRGRDQTVVLEAVGPQSKSRGSFGVTPSLEVDPDRPRWRRSGSRGSRRASRLPGRRLPGPMLLPLRAIVLPWPGLVPPMSAPPPKTRMPQFPVSEGERGPTGPCR